MRELTEQQVWRKARKVFVQSQPKGTFGPMYDVKFDRVAEVGYIDDGALLRFMGIEFEGEEASGTCICFCGAFATFNSETRRYHCKKPSEGGCGKLWVNLVTLVEKYIRERWDSKTKKSSRSLTPKDHIYVH